MAEQALTAEEIAEQLQVTPATVRGWLRTGAIEGMRLPGGDWRVWPSALQAFLARCAPQAQGQAQGKRAEA